RECCAWSDRVGRQLGSVLVAPLASLAWAFYPGAPGHEVFHSALHASLGELSLEDLVDLRVLILVLGLDAALFLADVRRVPIGALLRGPAVRGVAARLVDAQNQVRSGRLANIEVLVQPEPRA